MQQSAWCLLVTTNKFSCVPSQSSPPWTSEWPAWVSCRQISSWFPRHLPPLCSWPGQAGAAAPLLHGSGACGEFKKKFCPNMKIPGPAASHEKVLKLNSTAVVSLKTGKPVLKQLIMEPDNSLDLQHGFYSWPTWPIRCQAWGGLVPLDWPCHPRAP